MVDDKKRIQFIRFFNGQEEMLILKDSNNKVIRKFIHDEDIEKISNFHTQERANEKALLKYYSEKSKEEYIPTPKHDLVLQVKKVKDNDNIKENIRAVKNFKNENRIIFSNKKVYRLKSFKHSYIRVITRIYLDGYHTESIGRSDFYDGQIPSDLKGLFLSQAIKRSIAPFGSNVKYELLSWDYAYYQKKGTF